MNVGFLQLYDEIDWVAYAIEHALKLCDKLVIIEGSQFTSFKDIPIKSTDGTLEVINEKIEEHPNDIELFSTIRKYANYRQNQAANFNLVLKKCKVGDYFFHFDADEYYYDHYIKKLIEITEDGKIDVLTSSGPNFAFSFKWKLIMSSSPLKYKQIFFKKNRRLKFIKTHKPVNPGPNHIIDESANCLTHYKWVRPTQRMLIRHQTSGFYSGMLEWFNEKWEKIELIENKNNDYYGGKFWLERYDGPHPSVLKDHPWYNVEDIRKF